MPNWLKSMLSGGAAPGVFLGAFGKHPGWDDHIEPIGLDSEALLAARDILYTRGIGGVINEALWEKKPEETLPQIAHLFSWNGESDTIIGRMWSSVDGKGRARYPMVAVVHLELPFSYALAMRASRVLAGVEARCRQATTAVEVRGVFASGLEELRASLAQPPDGLGAEPDRAICTRVASGMGLNEGDTFARVLYAVERIRPNAHTPKTASSKINLKLLESTVPAQQYRLPMDTQDSIDGIAFWQKVVTDFTHPKLPLLFLHPTGYPWVDLVVGTPTPRQLYCIRANETGLPPASAVPYELDDAFKQEAAAFISKTCDLTPVPSRPMFAAVSDTPPPLPPLG